jgi:hypothetical protein
MACRSTEPRGGEENGNGTTRCSGCDAELLDSLDEFRECDRVLIFPDVVLIREGRVEAFERARTGGEVGVVRPDTPELDRGETEDLGGDIVRAADVAWCRSVGGAVAMALAFARLAAMAAATLLFFTCGVVGGAVRRACWLGHAFSSCLRFVPSCASKMTRPRSFHNPSKDQKATRAF